MALLTKIFGDANARYLKTLDPIVKKINSLEPEFEKLSEIELQLKTAEFKKLLKDGKTLDDILAEAFAAVREAARRTLGQRHFDVQLLGGIVLHKGQIAEMRTGEGKTLTATLPVYLNALTEKGVHVVTVNDYLAKRDTVWMGQIFDFLGLTIGCIQHESGYRYVKPVKDENDAKRDVKGSFFVFEEYLQSVSRREAYTADITYGTNNEFGFDYLRDNMVSSLDQMVQRPFHYAIVDEVDSILIDEARTPLIISAPTEEASQRYAQFALIVRSLQEDKHYNIDEKMRTATLSEEGIEHIEKILGLGNIYHEGGIVLVHHIEQALRAEVLFKKDRDYVVKDGEIIIVDEFTGRLMYGRRFSEGLHQAIEAKEGVEIKQESVTLATVTFQNFFRLYEKLAGMTGTAATSSEEFSKVYGLDVTVIPTNELMVRDDKQDRIYKTEKGKFTAVAREVKERIAKGQPILIGTISIEKNEFLSSFLQQEGVPHEILNAKNHEREAQIIAQAGKPGAVTLATNMAGRGVDIVLGGNPPLPEDAKKVREAGGLYVIGSERHEARRIDNQLRGRSGRQGDPGESRFFVSLEDDLMRIFGSDRMKRMMTTLRVPEDIPIENKVISRSIEAAQRKVEGNNFDIRKHLLEYDDVMNKHREAIYKLRRQVLDFSDKDEGGENLKSLAFNMVKEEIEQVILFHTGEEDIKQWNIKEICETMRTLLSIRAEANGDIIKTAGVSGKEAAVEARTKIIDHFTTEAEKRYKELEKKVEQIEGWSGEGKHPMCEIGKQVLLRSIDTLWVDHLEAMSSLREGIGLRGYGQMDPLIEYKKEAFSLFSELQSSITKQVAHSLFRVAGAVEMAPSIFEKSGLVFSGGIKGGLAGGSSSASQGKVGRNDPCPCGSGKKYKRCCGN